MAFNILVCLDTDEMGQLSPNHMQFLNDENRIDRAIRDLSLQWPNSTILVYRLNELQKLKTNPTYQRYKVAANGETVPV